MTAYYHTEIRGSRASRGLRRAQVRLVGGVRMILLHPSHYRGEWVVGRYVDGVTAPAETYTGETLASAPCVGRVRLSRKNA